MLYYKMKKNPNTPHTCLKISNSALETAMTCPRKYYWKYERKIVPTDSGGSAPLDFGIALHRALELRGMGHSLKECQAAFVELFPRSLGPSHTVQSGLAILDAYWAHYASDTMEVLHNEYPFEVCLGPVTIFGRLDKVVYLPILDKLAILDHKSTTKFGRSFLDMHNPNSQFSTYIFGGDCEFGDIDTLLVDGILVPYQYKREPKDKEGQRYQVESIDGSPAWIIPAFERVPTTRSPKDKESWKQNILSWTYNILKWQNDEFWPRADRSYLCSGKWANCPYRELCIIPDQPCNIEPPAGLFKEKERRDD